MFTKLSDITQAYMLNYIKENGTEEDKRWFIALVKDNWKETKNPFKQLEMIKKLDIGVVRRSFCERFFPELLKPKKSKTFLDEVMELENEL